MAQVMLVEDNPTNRKLMRDILAIKFDVIEAESAEAATELLASSRPDMIFMDLQLPGMDGLSFIRLLKQNPETQGIPIVAISAHAMPDDIDEALSCGCAEYITKPLVEDPFEFAERMDRLLQSATA